MTAEVHAIRWLMQCNIRWWSTRWTSYCPPIRCKQNLRTTSQEPWSHTPADRTFAWCMLLTDTHATQAHPTLIGDVISLWDEPQWQSTGPNQRYYLWSTAISQYVWPNVCWAIQAASYNRLFRLSVPTAAWHEYGIPTAGHPSACRILLPYERDKAVTVPGSTYVHDNHSSLEWIDSVTGIGAYNSFTRMSDTAIWLRLKREGYIPKRCSLSLADRRLGACPWAIAQEWVW